MMSIYLNLFLAAIKPITFFLPCAAVILGSGLSAYNGIVDGTIFTSLLVLMIIGQISMNLANDYQLAFTSSKNSTYTPSNPQQYQARMSMLKLILGLFLAVFLGLFALIATAIPGSYPAYFILALAAILMLITLRHKSRHGNVVNTKVDVKDLVIFMLLSGLFPTLLSIIVHTASITITDIIIAINFALLASISFYANKLDTFIQAEEQQGKQINIQDIKPILTVEKALILASTVMSLLVIFIVPMSLFTIAFALAVPSIFASTVTLEHFPDSDISNKQKNKVAIATFAYWVLFIVGLMMR